MWSYLGALTTPYHHLHSNCSSIDPICYCKISDSQYTMVGTRTKRYSKGNTPVAAKQKKAVEVKSYVMQVFLVVSPIPACIGQHCAHTNPRPA